MYIFRLISSRTELDVMGVVTCMSESLFMCYTHQRHSEDVDSMIIFTELMIYAYGYDK